MPTTRSVKQSRLDEFTNEDKQLVLHLQTQYPYLPRATRETTAWLQPYIEYFLGKYSSIAIDKMLKERTYD